MLVMGELDLGSDASVQTLHSYLPRRALIHMVSEDSSNES
jgi:hypothetical protein